ncbi:MAG: hypothetical protein NXI22_08975 [bacterium]|nr:hypothetical protein [bacterium]
MSSQTIVGSLVITVDVGPEISKAGPLYEAANRLMHRLEQYAMPATWCISDPAESVIADRVMQSSSHELAILGDDSWVGRTIPRNVFVEALRRRTEAAQKAGWKPTALALHQSQLRENLDVVADAGIEVVRPATPSRSALPRRIGNRLWESFAHVRLPRDWWFGNVFTLNRRSDALQTAAETGHTHHVQIDLSRLAFATGAGGVDGLLKSAFRLHSQQELTLKTLTESIQELVSMTRTRSVLSKAA